MMLVLAVITILATMATGSGNAAFYAFAELIPKLATQMGVNPAFLTIPMLQASNQVVVYHRFLAWLWLFVRGWEKITI